MLEDYGMSKEQATAVFEFSKPELNSLVEDYKINFNDYTSAYPPIVTNLLFALVKDQALIWINKNIPQAWFKPMFQ